MAGLLYLPRIFVYHSEADHESQKTVFKTMERQLLISLIFIFALSGCQTTTPPTSTIEQKIEINKKSIETEIQYTNIWDYIIKNSNNEKELPDAFLRRCFFHYIQFPDRETMNKIVSVHYPKIKSKLVSESLKVFYELRDVPGIKKKPSTSELLDWLKLLMNEDIKPEMLREKNANNLIPPLHGALLKNEQDVHLFERLAFLARRENG